MASVQCPYPGVFYRRPSPEEPEFIRPGDEVAEGQTIGLIEVMKSFSELKANKAGVLTGFLVDDECEVSVGEDIATIE